MPAALFAWEAIRMSPEASAASVFQRAVRSTWLLLPALPLPAWVAHHYAHTGYVFANPQFFRYNVDSTLQPLRIVFALLLRVCHLAGHAHLYLLTLAMVLAMFLPA